MVEANGEIMDINIHDIFDKIGRPQEVKEGRICGLCGQFDLEEDYAVIAIPSVGKICSRCHRGLENEVKMLEKLQDIRIRELKKMFTSERDEFIMVSDE
jgi:hypothetical protein